MSKLLIHFFNVGCGNMTLIVFPNGKTYLYDCNITDDNEDDVLAYLDKAMGDRSEIDVFVCSHRDSDHMRGLRVVHNRYPVGQIRDSGVEGTSCDSAEYKDYMSLRRKIGPSVIQSRTYQDIGEATLRYMNSADDDLSDANDQSIVMKIEFKGSSAILTGDTSFRPWKEKILPYYSAEKLNANILLAAHHGSLTFFDDPADDTRYTDHIKKIDPAMTLVSVGPNVHDLPDDEALELYAKHSRGSNKGNKVYRTDEQGNMKLILKEAGGWTLEKNQ